MSFDALFKLIPGYVDDLLHLLAGPVAFFSGRDLNDRKILTQAVLFLFNSTIIAYVLRVPVVGAVDSYWHTAIFTVVLYTPTAVVFGAVAWLSCRLVGGSGGLPGHVTIFAYIAGVSAVVLALTQLIAKGIIKLRLPEQFALYQEYMQRLFGDQGGLNEPRFQALDKSPELMTAVIVLLVGFIVLVAWTIWAWRAFAGWNGLSQPRNFAAFAVFVVLALGVSTLLAYAQAAVGVSIF